MIALEPLRKLYDYNYWARDRQLEACSKLSEEQVLRPMGNSFSSLRDTLAHLLGAEWIWLERFRGRSPQSWPSWLEEIQTTNSIRERWATVEAGMRDYIGSLSDEALGRDLTYLNTQGVLTTYLLWQALFHLSNHQSYHRGQVTTLLRQLGGAPPQIDFSVYCQSPR